MGDLTLAILAAVGFLFIGSWIGKKLSSKKMDEKIEDAKLLLKSVHGDMKDEVEEAIERVKKLVK